MANPNDIFHITIGVGPRTDNYLDREVQMIKSALLYGDRAKLCSFNASHILSNLALHSARFAEQMRYVEMYLQHLSVTDPKGAEVIKKNLELFRQLSKKKNRTRQELATYVELKRRLALAWKMTLENIDQWVDERGGFGVVNAITSGHLELYNFQSLVGEPLTMAKTMSEEKIWNLLNEFAAVMRDAVAGGRTYPFLDEQSDKLIKADIEIGNLNVSDIKASRGKPVKLAADLIRRLPQFELATVDEILDLRKELERPLIRFRSAMLQFSDKIQSAPWDEDFQVESETVFNRDVATSVLEIEDAVKSNRYLSDLVVKLDEKKVGIGGASVLTLILTNNSFLPNIISSALGIGMAVAAGSTAYNAYREWKKKQIEIEGKLLFFYYRAGRRLR